MPDIRTALAQALNEWEQDSPQRGATPEHSSRPSLTREVFEFIKANPGVALADIGRAMYARGYNIKSATSLVAQMTKLGMVRRDGEPRAGRYTAVAAEYEAVGGALYRHRRATKKAKVSLSPTVRKPASVTITPAGPSTVLAVPSVSLDEAVLDSLTIAQARSLYARLKRMFG